MNHEFAPHRRDARASSRPHVDQSFRALFELHHGALLRLLHVRGVDARDVEDLASEVWMAVHRRLPEEAPRFEAIEDPQEFRGRTAAWVAEFARLRAMRWRRDVARRWVILGATPIDDPPDDADGIEALLGRASQRALMRRVLADLSNPTHRALLEDLFIEDITQADAARARGWSESRLRHVLREALAEAGRVARRKKRTG